MLYQKAKNHMFATKLRVYYARLKVLVIAGIAIASLQSFCKTTDVPLTLSAKPSLTGSQEAWRWFPLACRLRKNLAPYKKVALAVFNLDENATQQDLDTAYALLAKKWDPENPTVPDKDIAPEVSQDLLKSAYALLKNTLADK